MRVNFWHLDTIAATSWEQARGYLKEELERLQATINTTWTVAHAVDGTQLAGTLGSGDIVRGTLAEQPMNLNASNDGLLFFITDFGRLVRYDASNQIWEDAPGTLPGGMIQSFAVAPTGTGWVLCNGGATTRLIVGSATLSSAAFTTPNLNATAAYLKSIAAYTGTINAASGSTANESAHTHTGPDHSHTIPNTDNTSPGTDTQGDHTHTRGSSSRNDVATTGAGQALTAITNPDNSSGSHSHTVNAHGHSFSSNTGNAGTGATGAGSAHAHTVGSLDVPNLGVLFYFKR